MHSTISKELSEVTVWKILQLLEAPTRNRVDIKISDTKTDAEKKLIEKRVKADFPLHLNVIISYVNA